MHTITSLRKALSLSTTNQVRNRIDAVRDVLEPHLRRGPNNQILLTDDGLALLRRLQELYDSGLRMTEASDVIRTSSLPTGSSAISALPRIISSDTKPDDARRDLVRALQDEVSFLRSRVADLEGRVAASRLPTDADQPPWWQALREDVDVS